MEFIREKLRVSSIEAVLSVVDYLIENPQLVESFIHVALTEKHKHHWRYCWTLRHLAEKNTKLLQPYKTQIFSAIIKIEDESCTASLLKAALFIGIDTDEDAELLDFALDKIITAQKSAIKYYLLDILDIFAQNYPEIIPEIIETITLASNNFPTPSLHRKTKKLIQKWHKKPQKSRT